MSVIDTDAIWLALGDFYDLFPDDERVYWITFWEAYADVVADLWGYGLQIDRAKSLFSTSPTFERREVRLQLTDEREVSFPTFRISSLKQNGSGQWVLRGFVPRELRSFTAQDVPDTGVINIGVDRLAYLSANSSTVSGGVYDGYVREVTFVLAEEPPHDYGDDPDFNDDFARDPVTLKFRIDQAAGSTTVDAVLVDTTAVTVNPTGRLRLGSAGVNAEIVDYESVTVIGDRYVFTLAGSWQSPDVAAEELDYDHFAEELLTVERYDNDRWSQTTSGRSRVVGSGNALFIIDQQPSAAAANATLSGQYQLQDNVDFDVSVAVSMDTWEDPVALSSSKSAFARINIAGTSYVVGVKTARDGAGAYASSAVFGPPAAPSELVLGTTLSLPYAFEARFKRLGSQLEMQFRPTDDDEFTLLGTVSVPGSRATLDLVVDDPDSESVSQVAFDEVVRRAGDVVGNTRLEEFFTASDMFPYTYDIDVNVVSAPVLQDRPRPRVESMVTALDVSDAGATTVATVAADADVFELEGVPDSGVLDFGDGYEDARYESFTENAGLLTFTLVDKIDPSLLPMAAGTSVTASPSVLEQGVDFEFNGGEQTLSMARRPTRAAMWAPVAFVDERHVQDSYGVLVDLDADVSTETYLNRVRGTWFALMNGPTIDNVRSGVHLAMGLPAAKTTGTVTELVDERDSLGRLTRRYAVVVGEDGAFTHDLNPSLYPFIDWEIEVSASVTKFQPLTNGVEVLDELVDDLWYQRFPGVADIERFNSFGVFVALEAISADSDVYDALRFALRVKPTYTKLFFRYLLTSGNEDLSNELEDDLFIASVPELCEDMTFDEGDVPINDPYQILRLGDGHKLGQGKTLGGTGQWHARTLGTYTEREFTGDGSITSGTGTFTSAGGHDFTTSGGLQSGTGSVAAASNVFTGTGFTEEDVGRVLVIRTTLADHTDEQRVEITGYVGPTQVQTAHTYNSAQGSLDWLVTEDLNRQVFVVWSTGTALAEITDVLDSGSVTVDTTYPVTESGLYWELRDYAKLGELGLGEYLAYECFTPSFNEPSEFVDATEIVNVAMGV